MYAFTVSIGEPDENYNKDWIDYLSESILFVEKYVDNAESTGTSFYLKGIGLITNYHVIAPVDKSDFESNVKIIPWGVNKHEVFANLKVFDDELDIAIISPIATGNLKPLVINDNPSYSRGMDVKILGFSGKNNQSRYDRPSVLNSKIYGSSKFNGMLRVAIEDDIVHGFSGGPVIDVDGRVLGVATNGHDGNSAKRGLFVPISEVVDLFNKM